MKTCPKCGDLFDTKSSHCPPCHNAYQKAYYKKRPESIRQSHRDRIARNREIIKAAKAIPCKDCKKQYPWYVMDFDHLRDKDFNLSERAGYSEKVILEEIAKCEVVCSNCHRERTFSRRSGVV